MRIIPYIIAAAATLSLGSCSSKDTSSEDTLTASVDSLFSPYFRPGEPGAYVLIAQSDSILYSHGFGLATTDPETKPADTTLFNICSISKQFAAIAALKLQEDGRLSLDDSIGMYLPQFKSDKIKAVTIRQMLSHTSGIPDSRPRTAEQWERYRRTHDSAFGSVEDFKLYALYEESTRYLDDLDSLAFTPGSAYEYQNPTYQLMLPIIEQATGDEFTSWMRDSIFAPAGMNNTAYLTEDWPATGFAHGYVRSDSDSAWHECDYGEANFFPSKADGALYTSPLEFLAWEKALFSGRIISDKSLKEATTPIIKTDLPDTYYGLGLFIEDIPGRPRKVFHTGDNGGFLTYEGYYPERDLFYLIFATHPHWPREECAATLDSIFIANKLL